MMTPTSPLRQTPKMVLMGLLVFIFLGRLWPAEEHIVIFHLNDLHGRIDPLAKVARLVEVERRQNPNVFLVTAGDNFSGNPVVDQYRPRGFPILDLQNRLGFAIEELGNHEFDYGQQALDYFIDQARFTIICANLRHLKPGGISVSPYAIRQTLSGTRIAFLGLIQADPQTKIPDTHPANLAGLAFDDPLQTAIHYRFLRQRNQVFVALTHLGYDLDVRLAQELKELDVIIGGHSHTAIPEPAETNGVLIVQAGSEARFLGRVDVIVDGGRVKKKTGRLIDLQSVTGEDAAISRRIADFNRNPELERILARLPFTLEGKDALGCLMTDAIRKELNLDVAFQNMGGIRLSFLKDPIQLKDVFRLDPFNNEVVRYTLSGKEIRRLIAYAFERGGQIDLQVSGICYDVKSDAAGKAVDVIITAEDGSPWDEERSYQVGLSSYVAATYQVPFQDAGESLRVRTNDLLIRFISSRPDWQRYRGVIRARVQPAVVGGADAR